MKDEDDIISGFDNETLFTPDFREATLLNKSGSTCDAYKCVVQRRHVFVKRLKAEYRNNPLYRAAFNKEYELGVSLSHPSLPRYSGKGEDYIMIDFIEGDTLSDVIKRGDNRLKDKRFVRKILGELIDVVEYLHNRNIVHCDIKADNLILSPYRDRPLTLIDLDKAYTSWQDDTSGKAENYDCAGCADGIVDLRGIGKIASKLGLRRVAAVGLGQNPTISSMRRALRPSFVGKAGWIGLVLAIVVIAGVIIRRGMEKENIADIPQTAISVDKGDSIPKEDNHVEMEMGSVENAGKMDLNENIASNENIEKPQGRDEVKETVYSAVTPPAEEIKTEDDGMEEVNNYLKKELAPLYKRQAYLMKLPENKNLGVEFLRGHIRSYADDWDKAYSKMIKKIIEVYDLHDHADAVRFIGGCREWLRFMGEDSKLRKYYFEEINQRLATSDSISKAPSHNKR